MGSLDSKFDHMGPYDEYLLTSLLQEGVVVNQKYIQGQT